MITKSDIGNWEIKGSEDKISSALSGLIDPKPPSWQFETRALLLRSLQPIRENWGSGETFMILEMLPIAPETKNTEVLGEAITNNWHSLASSEISDEAFARLKELAALNPESIEDTSIALSSYSLHYFLRFWAIARNEGSEPEFVLLPNGNLQAEWVQGDSQMLIIEFRPDGRVFLALVNNEDLYEGNIGEEELETFVQMLISRENNPLNWTYE